MMKAVVVTFLLLLTATYAKGSDDVLPIPVPIITDCVLRTKTVSVTKDCCTGEITVGYCSGLCVGSSEFHPTGTVASTKCACCKETRMIMREADLTCSEGLVAKYKYASISACGCLSTSCTFPQLPIVDEPES